MKIITRYVLREHFGPFLFALTALTSLMLLNFISRQFGELVGKGLPWSVIGEFFLLSIPFTVALTLPMSVLVAVLYAFSRLAAENEVTALKANGVSPWRLVSPALAGGVVMTIGLLAFNDQVLPRANHRLKTLQDDISQTKPALLLKEQVINSIVEGKFYLKAGKIINDPTRARLREVVIYDLTDPMRRRTIYADTARLAFASNRKDLDMDLFNGEMQEVSTDKPSQLNRLFYRHDRIKIRDVGTGAWKQTEANPQAKGDREMGICEMQQRLWVAQSSYASAEKDYDDAIKHKENQSSFIGRVHTPEPRGIGWAYCALLKMINPEVKEATAADLSGALLHRATPRQEPVKPPAQDTTKKRLGATPLDTGKRAGDTLAGQRPASPAAIQPLVPNPAPGAPQAIVPVTPGALPPGAVVQAPQNVAGQADSLKTQAQIAAEAAAGIIHGQPAAVATGIAVDPRVLETKIRVQIAQRQRDRYEIEIHKKFSLAAACLIFCIVAPPIALRFPRGGVGLVIGVSLVVFALYYVGLIGGEALANKGFVPPFWAMWGTNVIMTLVGIVMLLRMGNDSGSGRGGGIREWLDERQLLREERRAAALARAT
ncbi:MAG: permease YjgP/YjgQ family protein [Gemmatimonadetes bacterium]|nr:permease YjgP/YjgQ family protein [Gemmatimonadota bacterium]